METVHVCDSIWLASYLGYAVIGSSRSDAIKALWQELKFAK